MATVQVNDGTAWQIVDVQAGDIYQAFLSDGLHKVFRTRAGEQNVVLVCTTVQRMRAAGWDLQEIAHRLAEKPVVKPFPVKAVAEDMQDLFGGGAA